MTEPYQRGRDGADKSQISRACETGRPGASIEGTWKGRRRIGRSCPPGRAEEDRVLSHARRTATHALIAALAALPVLAVVIEGAKRW